MKKAILSGVIVAGLLAVGILNGCAKENGRVKTLKMYFNEEYICDLELLDTMKPQYISLGGLNLSAANNESSVF